MHDILPHAQASRSPGRRLRGNRPTLLKVNKDSRTITKLTKTTLYHFPGQAREGGHLRRPPPVIIYEVPPKVIHVLPKEFKEMVQHLTGKSSIQQVTPLQMLDQMIKPLQPDFSTEAAPDNMLILSSDTNQELSFYWPGLESDDATSAAHNTIGPGQSFDEFSKFWQLSTVQ